MMAFTHLFMSLALAALVSPLVSEYVAPPVVLVTAVIGGLAPDLDLFARHRRTLHYPIYFPLLTLVAVGSFVATGVTAALVLMVFFAATTLHVFSDLLGGSAERTPWDPVTEFGVYNHVLGRWHRPRRLVQYSGSPGDLLLGIGFGLVALFSPVTAPTMDTAIVVLAVVAAGYTLVRKHLSSVTSLGARVFPKRMRRLVPVVSVEECDGGGTTVAIRLNR